MEKVMQKEEIKMPEAAKKPESQRLQTPSSFAEELSKYPSFMDGLLKFICHPFILFGGIMVAIYFFYKARQSGSIDSENTKLREMNSELLVKVKSLNTENKKLKNQLGFVSDNENSNDQRKEKKLLTTSRKKISTAYLE